MIELDALFHQPNWKPTPAGEFRQKVLDALGKCPDGWVCDGNYGMVRDIVLSRANTVVWLRLPFRVAYWRLLKRTISRAWTKEPLWGTNYESWRMTFLSRDSILLWGVSHWRAHFRNLQRDLAGIPHQAILIELHSTREVGDFLEDLEA